jgi:exopolysaccharide biosynthesis polyprenyl glycosylphosphotransferase
MQTTRQPERTRGVIRRRTDAAFGRSHPIAGDFDVDISAAWEAVPNEQGSGRRRDTVLRRTLAFTDVLAAFGALAFVMAIGDSGVVQLRPSVVLLVPLVVLAGKAIGLYDRDQHILRKTTIDEVPSLVYLSVLYAMTVWLAESLLLRHYLGRPEVFGLILSSLLLFATGRVIARGLLARVGSAERCLILGNAVDAARIADKLDSAHGVTAVVTGRVALDARDEGALRASRGVGPVFRADTVGQIIAEQHVERVIIAPDGHDQDEVLHVIRLIKAMGVKVSVLPRLLEVVGSSSTFEDVDGLTLLGVRQYGVSKSSQCLKRSMDIVGAAVGLLLLAPVLTGLAIAVRLDSRGPAFFRQRRIGRQGELFAMIKFRSMVPEADAIKDELRDRNEVQGGLFKIADDPRVTRVGRFLRRTSLDELPQLFNVLGGSMSLVGPRPLVQDEDALIEGWQRRRLAVKPGMTGLWQIFGSSRIPMNEMVKIDYLYGANWSIWLDLKILLRTVPYVLRRRGQ